MAQSGHVELSCHQTDFICLGCGARYKVVRVKVEAGRPHRPVQCLVCKKPLAATDGENILKYFPAHWTAYAEARGEKSPAEAGLLRGRRSVQAWEVLGRRHRALCYVTVL